MDITGTQTIAAPRQRVWDALNDPDILKRCLPGCESVLRISPEEFKVVMAAAIGPLRAKFNGALKMADVQAPASCTMVFEGQGGAVGFGKGHSSITLAESAGQTALAYTAQAQVGGKLAQVGSRLIDSVARKMADDFFKAFKAQLATPAEPAAGSPSASQAATAPTSTVARENPAPRAAAASAPAAPAAVPHPQPASLPMVATATPVPSQVMVPGWWLGVATLIGSAITLAGALLVR